MSSSLSTIPAKHSTNNSENKFIRYSLIFIWGILILFGFISILQPQWLVNISSSGKISEALDHNHAGDIYLKKGNYRAAVIQYKKAINIQPDLINAIGNLGISYTQLKRYNDAIRIFKSLLKTDKKNTYTNYYSLAEVYKRKGDTESAIKCYIKSAETNPYPVYTYQYLGELYLKLNNWNLAIESFELALANKLTLENSYYGMLKGVEKSSIDEPDILKAVESFIIKPVEFENFDNKIFDAMLKKDREIAKTYNFLGYAFHRNNQFKKARENYQIALNIWPNFEEAKKNLKELGDVKQK